MSSIPTDGLLRARVDSVLDVALHHFLGLALLDPMDPAEGIGLTVGAAAVNNAGVLHGGIATALLDVAAYLALLPDLGPQENAVTHDLSASLIRSVPRGAQLQVRASVLRRGRSIVFLRADATVEGTVVAAGQVTKTVLRPEA